MTLTGIHGHSAYGYVPNLPANVTASVLFGLVLAVQLVLGAKTRDWWMFGTWGLTAALECVGYIARSLSHSNGSLQLFEIQVFCILVAPVFMAAGLYYQLAKEITIYGTKYSPLKPMTYTAICTTCDFLSFFIQGGGGGITAASVNSSGDLNSVGQYVSVAGVLVQIVSLVTFIFMFGWVSRQIFTDPNRDTNWNPEFEKNRQRPLYKFWLPAVSVSLLFLLIRSIYRVIELSVGFRGYLMRTERYLLILDALMIFLGMIPLCIVYPGVAYGSVPVEGLSNKKRDVRRVKPEVIDQKALLQPNNASNAQGNFIVLDASEFNRPEHIFSIDDSELNA